MSVKRTKVIRNMDSDIVGLVKTSNFMFDKITVAKNMFAKLFLCFFK